METKTTDADLNCHTAASAARAYRANRLEAMRLLQNMLTDLANRTDPHFCRWCDAGAMAALRISLEEVLEEVLPK